jgi:hypothetical protein
MNFRIGESSCDGTPHGWINIGMLAFDRGVTTLLDVVR